MKVEADQVVSAKVVKCLHCGTAFGEGDHHLHKRCDKIEPVPPCSDTPGSIVGVSTRS